MTVGVHARRAGPAIAALAASLVAGPAAAQWFGEPVYYAPMPPRAVVGMLYADGFRAVGRPRWTGDRYVVDAVDRRGVQVRLMVDGYGGMIGGRPLAAWRPVPPRDVGAGPVRVGPIVIGPIDIARLNPFRDDARADPLPASPGREIERRRERPRREAARTDAPAGRASERVKAPAAIEARAPEPSAAKPAALSPAAPQPSAPAASPPAPAPAVEAPRPETPREPPTAAAAPNVRVIEGVTPVISPPTPPEPPVIDRPATGTSF